MPIQQGTTTRDGERVGFYRWGDDGKMYIYELGNARSRAQAKRYAKEQQQAAYASGYEG